METATRYRVHGEIKIKRRKDFPVENHYSKYRESLKEDFSQLCGYCGKHMVVSRKGFEIDHFVPVSTDIDRETDYNNLVFSCFTCNRKKSKKWPTENKNLCHDGIRGFIDPTSEEFDNHLGRNSIGSIEHYTEVGKYMHQVFKFDLRPTDIVWKCMELNKRKETLYQIKRKSNLKIQELELFMSIQEELDGLLEYLLGIGE
ncbi:HNH endonuclease signature motif containing protein [Pullulanibacillus sp. KACC 23026]|uniref:HNH endonuclease n=1 Tax=Pullulanibacillus sp. KACC 23026 TaxID=3028315 RepID=UPI0023AE923A|nr:HNH endonuclease signature motif containing protein [Pullulanibacillus sp. KACC 23026]WEG12601.1 HNH endonuclease signature motif containing protein [Pullulanibacillus sp. KACC 23026]